jgi:hypothetical protein
MKYGFAPGRVSAAGYAEYHPVNSSDTAEGRAQNRRVDVVMLGRASVSRTAPPVGGDQEQQTGAKSATSTLVPEIPRLSPAIPAASPSAH